MSKFQPTRASPPGRYLPLDDSLPSQVSRSSTISIPELAHLSQDDVDFLDSVIDRAGPSATTFLSVFKAYNDVLHDRGMDPQNEVIYYGKLLKLGTLKGKSWTDKWNLIKLQQGYDPTLTHGSIGAEKTIAKTPAPMARNIKLSSRIEHDDDAFTLHSYQTDSGHTETDYEQDMATTAPRTEPDYPHQLSAPRLTPLKKGALGLYVSPSYEAKPLVAHVRPVKLLGTRAPDSWDTNLPEERNGDLASVSTIPPPYTPAKYLNRLLETRRHLPFEHIQPKEAEIVVAPPSVTPSSRVRDKINAVKAHTDDYLNEEDAWTKIKSARDEKEADAFRADRLRERCWEVWKEGYRWIITTNAQIDQARLTLLLRLHMQQWRARLASRVEIWARVTSIANKQALRQFFHIWKAALKNKRQTEWRNEMRSKMKIIRAKRNDKLQKDAWARWRQLYRSRLAGQRYLELLRLRFYDRWKKKLWKLDSLQNAADQFRGARDDEAKRTCWDWWKRSLELRSLESTIAESVNLGIISRVFDMWQAKGCDNRRADDFYSSIIIKRYMNSWKTARDRIRILEKKADKHVVRQDDLLLRAVFRVWRAHELGQLLSRVRNVRSTKNCWLAWTEQIRRKRRMQDSAVAFSLRSRSTIAVVAVHKWHEMFRTHLNAQSFSVQYYSAQLCFKTLLTWRIQLRHKLKMIKRARIADQFFVARRTWRLWTNKLLAKRREAQLKTMHRQRLTKLFHVWLQRTRQQRAERLAERQISGNIRLRILSCKLSVWTNRVIRLKIQELDVSRQYELRLIRRAMKKWRRANSHHQEEYSLMESYQEVKREEIIRRVFHRWLSAARAVKHRRVILQQFQEEKRQTIIDGAWDKWRDKFKDERLRPLEYETIIRNQKNSLRHFFDTWRKKTKSLPAIHLEASRTKFKYWRNWREAMPRAFQARTAREVYEKGLLTRTFKKWFEAYKGRIALKAIARARHLRLPTTSPGSASAARQILPSKPYLQSKGATRKVLPADSAAETYCSSRVPEHPPVSVNLRAPKPDIPLSRPFKSSREDSPPRSRLRGHSRGTSPSPSRSSVGNKLSSTASAPIFLTNRLKTTCGQGDKSPNSTLPTPSVDSESHRSKLWQELRGVQRRSRPPTERSPSR